MLIKPPPTPPLATDFYMRLRPYLRPVLAAARLGIPLSIAMPSATPKKTLLLDGTNELDLTQAAQLLRTNHLVAFPTETVYGLGANALSSSATSSIFHAKSRPCDNPLIVHIASPADLYTHSLTAPLSPQATALANAFWPGPLTLVLPLHAESKLAKEVTAGLDTVAVRVPKHPVASALLAKAGVPVAAPSANLSGRPSPTCARHVMSDLEGRVDAVVDGGELWKGGGWGVESTVVHVGEKGVEILRPGVIGIDDIRLVMEEVLVRNGEANGERVRAPGMKYRHYAPRARLEIVEEGDVGKRIKELREDGRLVGVLAAEGVCRSVDGEGVVTVRCGRGDVCGFARGLYRGLRAFDGEEVGIGRVDVILAVPPRFGGGGVEEAVMNRLMKAAAKEDVE